MPEMELYHARSGNSLRAAIALELSQVTFKRHSINLAEGEQKNEEFLQINPAGHVPIMMLKEGSQHTMIPQSGAIMEYVLRQYRPDLWPENEIERAICNACVYGALTDIAIPNMLTRYIADHAEAAKFVINRMWNDMFAMFIPVKNTDFLCGDNKTVADYANFPVVYMREMELQANNDAKHIMKWFDKMKEDKEVMQAVEYSGAQIT